MLKLMMAFPLLCAAFLATSYAYGTYTTKTSVITIKTNSGHDRDSYENHGNYGGFGDDGPRRDAGGYRVEERYYQTREHITSGSAYGGKGRYGGKGPYQVYERFGSKAIFEPKEGSENSNAFGSFGRYGGLKDIPESKEPSKSTRVHISFSRYGDNKFTESREPAGNNNGFGRPSGYGGKDTYESRERYGIGRTNGGNERKENSERFGAGGISGRNERQEISERYEGGRTFGGNERQEHSQRFGAGRISGGNELKENGERYEGGRTFGGNERQDHSERFGAGRIFGRNELKGNSERYEGGRTFGGNERQEHSERFEAGRISGRNELKENSERYEGGRTFGGNERQEHNERYGNNGGFGGKQSTGGGCDIDSGRRLSFGETYRKGDYIIKCEKLDGNTLRLTPVKCIMDGDELDIGERKRKGGFGYACQRTDTGLRLNIVGCFGDEDFFVGFGDTFPKNKFIYMCLKDGDLVEHKAYGCIVEGRRVRLGETAPAGPYLQKCSPTATGGIRIEVVACLDKSGNRFDIGERFREGPFFYECKKAGSGVTLALAGCVAKALGREQEFRFGESWSTDSNSPLSYKMQCVGDGTKASAEITHCVARLGWADSVISVGNTVELPKDMVFLCRRKGDGSVSGRVISCDDFEKSEGYKFCGKTRF